MAGELGKASLDLEANLGPFERNLETAHAAGDRLQHALDGLAAVADVCQKALNDVKLDASHAAESRVSAEQILRGVHGISGESRTAARELDKVKLGNAQASETEVAGAVIDHELDNIHDKAERTRRALDGVRLRLAGARLGGGSNRPGYGVGPFGAGYGRLGLVGSAIGLGVLAGPALAPAAVGLLAAIPTMVAGAAGALGTLALALDGVGKAIGGDKKAFNDLTPAAKKFVLTVRSLDGWFDRLRQTAAKSVFPGLTAGLKAALSPGTVGVITKAVTELGHAIGAAGAQWGRYFGSPEFQSIFAPLMQSAARNIGVLSDAFLHLFDALGVLARAAIPFTNWITSMVDKGAKLADTWIHAKDASGQLAGAMNEAKTSLELAAKLVGALLKAVFALGQALYPVAKIALKDLTDGLDALAGIIEHNQKTIREVVRGALDALVATIKILTPLVKGLAKGIEAVVKFAGGWKLVFMAIIGLKFGQVLAGWSKALAKLIGIEGAEGGLVGAEAASGGLLANLTKLAGLGVITVEVLVAMHFISKYGLKNSIEAGINPAQTLGPDITPNGTIKVGGKYYRIGTASAYEALVKAGAKLPPIGRVTAREEIIAAQKLGGSSSIPLSQVPKRHHHHHSTDPKPGTHAWYMKYLGYDPTQLPSGNIFGSNPPFTKNLGGSGSGSKSPIPQLVRQLDAEAARQDQAASALHYAGAKARKHLEQEIVDLQKADRILEEKLKGATGKKRTALYNALTGNLKKIAEARKRMSDAMTKDKQDALNLALDQAKLAVENAMVGSKAWDKAITAEEKALKAESSYWAKRAHNDKLSAHVRDEALRKELEYEKQLKGLLTQRNQAVAANEAQFLTSFVDIQNAFASNAFPVQPTPGSGKTDTHLHEIKNESRKTNAHLQAIRSQGRFPGSAAATDAAMAVAG